MSQNSNPSSTSTPPPHLSPHHRSDSQQAEHQLLSELAKAANEGMVSTRSQGDVLQDVDANSQPDRTVAPPNNNKRKILEYAERVLVDNTGRDGNKRRRSNSNEAAVVIQKAFTDTLVQRPLHHEAGDSVLAVQTQTSIELENGLNSEEAPSTITIASTENTITEERIPAEEANVSIMQDTATQQASAERRPSRQMSGPPIQESRITQLEAKAARSVAKVVHKRFGSEDVEFQASEQPNLPGSTPTLEEVSNGEEEEEDSEDEAPEAISATAGLNQVRAAAAEAERVAKTQQDAIKAKRREHDMRMKSQAKSSKKSLSKKTSSKKALPALLPEDILAEEPTIRPPTPPAAVDKSLVPKEQKFVDSAPRPPKDLKRGNTRVRVLQADKSILPPRSSMASKNIREAWLIGQRFKAGVPRRKAGGGFVRER